MARGVPLTENPPLKNSFISLCCRKTFLVSMMWDCNIGIAGGQVYSKLDIVDMLIWGGFVKFGAVWRRLRPFKLGLETVWGRLRQISCWLLVARFWLLDFTTETTEHMEKTRYFDAD
ncbi:MAG: hypothetical protein Q7T18_09080 [Sedimentisphaerales bacterium]|nr:hypothetical protein [Sedimentisphaerales bacterium]